MTSAYQQHAHNCEVASLSDKTLLLQAVMDEQGELHKRESGGGSWLEDEMNTRFLLEVSVLQRSVLVSPFTLRDAKAIPSLPLTRCCPSALHVEDCMLLMKEMEGVGSSFSSRVCWDETYRRGWTVCSLSSPTTSSSTSTASSSAVSATAATSSSNKQTLYIHRASGIIQQGLPFDLCFRQQRKILRAELR